MNSVSLNSASQSGLRRDDTALDRLIGGFDQALKTLAGTAIKHRPNPSDELSAGLSDSIDNDKNHQKDRQHVAALMRINHAGEVAAQALYQGQSITARDVDTRLAMRKAAAEEADHLAWCAERIDELGGRTSLLNPLWYAGSLAIGAIAGLAGDKISLGFVVETEKQVSEHLERHLQQLPANDVKTRAIVTQMRDDETQHGATAKAAGGIELPLPVRAIMRFTAKVMTHSSYWL